MSAMRALPRGLGRVSRAEVSAEANMSQMIRALETRVAFLNNRVQSLEDERAANQAELLMMRRQMEKLPVTVMRAFEREQERTRELERRVALMEGAM